MDQYCRAQALSTRLVMLAGCGMEAAWGCGDLYRGFGDQAADVVVSRRAALQGGLPWPGAAP
jgi:hypothetical protein